MPRSKKLFPPPAGSSEAPVSQPEAKSFIQFKWFFRAAMEAVDLWQRKARALKGQMASKKRSPFFLAEVKRTHDEIDKHFQEATRLALQAIPAFHDHSLLNIIKNELEDSVSATLGMCMQFIASFEDEEEERKREVPEQVPESLPEPILGSNTPEEVPITWAEPISGCNTPEKNAKSTAVPRNETKLNDNGPLVKKIGSEEKIEAVAGGFQIVGGGFPPPPSTVLTLTGTDINGRETTFRHRATIVTGSTRTIIREDIVRKNQLRIRPLKSASLRALVGGDPMKVLGGVDVSLGLRDGTTVESMFLVTDKLCQDISLCAKDCAKLGLLPAGFPNTICD